jgi:peptidylprolyl isomerase
MKKIIVSTGAVLLAGLVIMSAGCVSPSTGSSPAAFTPSVTAGTAVSGTTSLPGNGTAATPVPASTAVTAAVNPDAARKGDTVSVYYTGKFENGTVFDSNMDQKPVEFTLGNSSIIDGIDEAVTGMVKDQQKTVIIPAEKAYGTYNASLVRTVNRTGPIANTTFVKGQYFTIHDRETDSYSVVKILDVTPSTVTWDANSPLAGLNFTFTLKLEKITRP